MMYYPDVPALEPDELELLCHEYLEHNATLDPHLADQMGVKRGLRNLDGTGVLAGITNVSNVIGYDKKEDGTIVEAPCDGLVTDEERAVIDRVLKYENLGRRYNPDKSDAVKNCFNEYASQEDIKAYFEVWAQMFKKDPECYISALINNYYGYFYPSARDAWVYSTARSAEIMAKPDNLKYFDFHPVDSKAVRWCDHLINLYRVAVQRIPFISLPMSSATYVWIMIVVVVYLLRRHSWRALAIWIPLLGVLVVCLIGPCNGSTYMRYLYPVIACMPFAIGATITRSDLLWT